MGTLRALKAAMRLDTDLRKMLVRGNRNEILIDVDGDKEADIAIIDMTGSGDIDTVAVDLTGGGDFNIYIRDTDHNGVPDTVLLVEDDDELSKVISGSKEETEAFFIEASWQLYKAITTAQYVAAEIDAGLRELDRKVRKARRDFILGR